MNLRVDLILESEQRSASVINRKSLIRIFSVAVPALILALVVNQVTVMMRLGSRLDERESEWKTMEPKERAARQLAAEYQVNSAILGELQGWRRSHMEWHGQLAGLLREVPREIQLQTLKVDQVLQVIDDKTPARVFTLTLRGKATGENAESSVRLLERRLRNAAAFSALVTGVDVKQFGADITPGAHKEDRVFEILCNYRGCKFE